ncbi:TPA: hypothetical protein NG603_004451 [Vibrio parahaemolyticus]|nr:hypothetical protein [Vibrio parahaemolyticus]
MAYTFRYTEENGYKKVHMSKKDHNALFVYRQIKWNCKYEYLLNEQTGHFVMLRLASLPAKVLLIVCYPLIVLLNGLANIKEVNKEVRDLFLPKENGSFTADDCYRTSKDWGAIMSAIKAK